MEERVRALLAATRLRVDPPPFVLVRLPAAACSMLLARFDQQAPCEFLSLVRSAEETTVLLTEAAWGRMAGDWPDAVVERGWRLITLEQSIALDVAGYLAPLAQALAAAGIPLLVVSAFSTDHLLVHERDLTRAKEELQRVIDEAGRGGADGGAV